MRPNGTDGLGKQFVKARMTVWLFLVLLEGTLIELLKAERTGEVLGMILLGHGRDAAARNRSATAGAQSSSLIVVMVLAEWLPFHFKIVTSVKGQLAVPADKAV